MRICSNCFIFVGMKTLFTFTHIRRYFLFLFLIFIGVCRYNHSLGEWYARHLYPVISAFLSGLTSFIPFSLEEITVIAIAIGLTGYPFYAKYRKRTWRTITGHELEMIAWTYVWFYIGWGLNYFRTDYYERMNLEEIPYETHTFEAFLKDYTHALNASYTPQMKIDRHQIIDNIKQIYQQYPSECHLLKPRSFQRPKTVLFNRLYSSTGVLGFMGPFFNESQLNNDLLPHEYPFTYAHELAHLLGVSSEAEANFWAYQTCIRSPQPSIRYSGYLGILGYVWTNVQMSLPEEKQQAFIAHIRPEIKADFKKSRLHWENLRSPFIDRLQTALYSWYLKGNQLPEGIKDYNGVVGLVVRTTYGKSTVEKP